MKAILKKIIICVLACFVMASCSNAQKGHSKEKIDRFLEHVEEGKQIVDSAWVIDEGGDTLRFAEHFKGKWLLIDYWTAGCIPCIKEFPVLDAYYQRSNKEELEIITLSVDSKKKRWEKAKKKQNFSMPKYYAGRDNTNPFLAINFQVMTNKDSTLSITTLTPQYVLIDPNGVIVDKDLPKPSDKEFQSTIDRWMQK